MAKTRIEDCFGLTASKVAKLPCWGAGTVTWGKKKEPLASISVYRVTDLEIVLGYSVNDQPVHYSVKLNMTLLPWERQRYWFSCPTCGRRVAHLYKPGHHTYFLCRHCHNLTYRSQQVNNRWSRMFNELDKL